MFVSLFVFTYCISDFWVWVISVALCFVLLSDFLCVVLKRWLFVVCLGVFGCCIGVGFAGCFGFLNLGFCLLSCLYLELGLVFLLSFVLR